MKVIQLCFKRFELALNIWPCTAFKKIEGECTPFPHLILTNLHALRLLPRHCEEKSRLFLLGSIYSLMKFISRSSHGKLMGREQSVKTLWYNGLLVGYRLTVYRIQVISTTYIIYPLDSFLLPNFLVVGSQHHKSPRYQAFFFLNYKIFSPSQYLVLRYNR